MTISQAASYFRDSLKNTYQAPEANILFSMVLDIPSAKRLLNGSEILTVPQLELLENALKQLIKGIPIQYILGKATFLGRDFTVTPDVLIPRPETEELVQWVLDSCRHTQNLTILDIGTGSGCIPISVKLEMPGSQVYALDISAEALGVAQLNARKFGIEIYLLLKDILSEDLNGLFDVIISNPPYIASSERSEMETVVLDHEPHVALFVPDEDVLLFYRAITNKSIVNLNPGGTLYFEINQQFGKEVVELMTHAGFVEVELKKDINGNDRLVRGYLPG